MRKKKYEPRKLHGKGDVRWEDGGLEGNRTTKGEEEGESNLQCRRSLKRYW